MCVYCLISMVLLKLNEQKQSKGPQVGYKIMAHGVLAALRGLIVKTR